MELLGGVALFGFIGMIVAGFTPLIIKQYRKFVNNKKENNNHE